MKRKLVIGCCAGMLAFLVLSTAPYAWAVEGLKGNWSLGFYAAFNQSEIETMSGDTTESDLTIVNGSLGYFLTDHMEINLSPTIASSRLEGLEMNLNNYFGNIKYNFYGDTWQAVPYVGFQAGITRIEISYEAEDPEDNDSYDDTSYSLGFMGGIKMFLSENLSLDLEYNWLWSPDLVADLTMSTVFVGFKWYFGGN